MLNGVDSYMFSIIGNFANITTSDDKKIRLLKEKTAKLDLFLQIDKQIRYGIKIVPNGQPEPVKEIVKKPYLINGDESIMIKFNDDRIDIRVKNSNSKYKTSELKNILEEHINLISNIYSLSANRLALNVDYVISDYDDEEVSKVYRMFLRPALDFYKDNNYREWQAYLVKGLHDDKTGEELNAIMSAVRGNLTNDDRGPIAQDIVLIHFDVNTKPLPNKSYSISKILSLKESLVTTYDTICNDLEVKLNAYD